ncbi:integration host factor subunit alpha [Desulfobacterota bacterium AH_259_B03_O07]|nr:integration host factor subunit alpha [Desulfobacterota bacterium AH_259_B03_O07]
MTKKELADVIHEKIGISRRECAEIVDFFFNIVKEKLARGERVQIRGFGSFRLQKRKARKGRNPTTGDAIVIADRNVVTFKPSRFLRDSINELSVGE